MTTTRTRRLILVSLSPLISAARQSVRRMPTRGARADASIVRGIKLVRAGEPRGACQLPVPGSNADALEE